MILSDGIDIYVKVHNPEAEKKILLIHGGPGDGAVSFGLLIEKIKSKYTIVEVDQRGCCRSDQDFLGKITVLKILMDFEEIREQLRYDKWYILGHSFGGFIAIWYAAQFPSSVSGVVLENPAIDMKDSVNCILSQYIRYFEAEGMKEDKNQIERVIGMINPREGLQLINGYPNHIRCDFWGIYKLDKSALAQMALVNQIPLYYEKLNKHAMELSTDKDMNLDGWEMVRKIKCPVLMLYGEWDHITDESMRRHFLQTVQNGTILEIPKCGHYIHLGQTNIMCERIGEFIGRPEHNRMESGAGNCWEG